MSENVDNTHGINQAFLDSMLKPQAPRGEPGRQAGGPPAPPTEIHALRGKLVVERDTGPEQIGAIVVPEAYRDKRGARARAVLGTVRDVGAPDAAADPYADGTERESDFSVGQRVLFEESTEHGVSEYLPSLGPNLVIVRQDRVLAVLEDG